MTFLLKILLFINICVMCYMIYLVFDFRKDVKSVKETVRKSSEIVRDIWSIVGGSAIDKITTVKNHGAHVKDWIKAKWGKNNKKEN